MVNPLTKFVGQIVLGATRVFSQAFSKAYAKEAAKNAGTAGAKSAGAAGAAGANSGGAGSGASSSSSSSSSSRGKRMQPDEAYRILSIEADSADPKIIHQNYLKLFTINDVSQGGSFYLQSKVFRAKQTLDDIHKPYRPPQSEIDEWVAANDKPVDPPSIKSSTKSK
jgi:import inner membrane translocase subunit TIM16